MAPSRSKAILSKRLPMHTVRCILSNQAQHSCLFIAYFLAHGLSLTYTVCQ